MINIVNATVHDVPTIRHIAETTWWPTYSSILSAEQLRYMLDTIYATDALTKQIAANEQTYILLSDANGPQGFASYGPRHGEPGVYKLHKLYVLPQNQGKGYGVKLIGDIKGRLAPLGVDTLDLNVNRFNRARTFYEKVGFTVLREEDVPIGPYWMNDYVMRLRF